MELPGVITAYLTTRQTRPDGQFIRLRDPDDLMLEILGEQFEENPDAKIVRVICPNRYSVPSGYSYSWYLAYPDRTFQFEGAFAIQYEQAAIAARARQGEWF